MDSFHSLLRRRWPAGKGSVLATLVAAEGHAYRKPGAVMLIDQDGTAVGHLSPGCVEMDLMERAKQVIVSGCTDIAVYDVREPDDLSFGEAVGCGGLLRILLEPVDSALEQALGAMHRLLNEGFPVKLVRILSANEVITEYRIRGGDRWHERFVRFSENRSGMKSTITFVYEPNPRLLLFGAGDDAVPVAELAARIGFSVIVADRREALCTAQRFPEAAATITGGVDDMLAAIAIRHDDRAVVMTHQMEQDRSILERLVHSPLRYIGILGSARRRAALIEGLFKSGDSRLRSPVGIVAGTDGAERIALSIAAELLEDVSRVKVMAAAASGL
ncbi:XdhC family protein [Paenibacillus xylaniclasticus]|uniref:XdhC family protein n=1 Tax=Paenibacillus xylaniclasticus TaxID=588083 RepID=UPI000FD6E0B9|nr:MULTISPECIES: XdhC/CoxI family protein [Paenibacillus]GFN33673.1 xanthine dehydrogenase [Paenibacillus curdlanolyticus]